MSKPHLAIQNQAVKYAQKDMNGDDISIKDLENKIPNDTITMYEINMNIHYGNVSTGWSKDPTGYMTLIYKAPDNLTIKDLMTAYKPISATGDFDEFGEPYPVLACTSTSFSGNDLNSIRTLNYLSADELVTMVYLQPIIWDEVLTDPSWGFTNVTIKKYNLLAK